MRKTLVPLSLVIMVLGVASWVVLHLLAAQRQAELQAESQSASDLSSLANNATAVLSWSEAVERVKAYRTETGNAKLEIPAELWHYSDRHWFLATQVAEIGKYNLHSCQDFVDLAAMIERGELVAVPDVTETYVLYGVGAKADDGAFTRHEDNHSVALYDEAQLAETYKRLDDKRSDLLTEIEARKVQSDRLNRSDRSTHSDLLKQINARKQELKSTEEDKALLDQFYGRSDIRQKLFRDYQSLQALAKNFAGRSFNLDSSSDRHAMKVNMLRSLRPQALKVLEEIASAYYRQFDRPLPVSSLVRPEQYQHALRKVNRNAVLIDTPPHSTGLAFDIDYRYMNAAEQTLVMAELARLKKEGRIEVIRERSANYHVFAFISDTRPGDDMITASLDKASAPVPQANQAIRKPANVKSESHKRTRRTVKAEARRRR